MTSVIKFFKANWRELLGWITIIAFAYLYVFQANSAWWLKGRTYAFPFLLSATAIILTWLRVNSKKR
jgi:hypothetical protein